MLKPLFGKALNMSTVNYGTGGSASHPHGAYGRSRPVAAGYVREADDEDFEMSGYNKTGRPAQFTRTTVQGGVNSSDDGSETFILNDVPDDKVMMKTEVRVTNHAL